MFTWPLKFLGSCRRIHQPSGLKVPKEKDPLLARQGGIHYNTRDLPVTHSQGPNRLDHLSHLLHQVLLDAGLNITEPPGGCLLLQFSSDAMIKREAQCQDVCNAKHNTLG